MEQATYYIQKLKDELSQRQRANDKYSLRAFSRDIDVHSSTLSLVLNGKRSLPIKKALVVAQNLELSPKEHTLFMESFYRTKTKLDFIEIKPIDDSYILDESYYKVIAEWEHYAVLELFDLKDFVVNKQNISNYFNITANRTDVVIENLINSKLLERKDDHFVRIYSDLRTTNDISSLALKKSHEETLDMAKQQLNEINLELREYFSQTQAIDLNKIPEAKTIIREFGQKMAQLLRDGDKTDVYQLGIQFYPLNQKGKKL